MNLPTAKFKVGDTVTINAPSLQLPIQGRIDSIGINHTDVRYLVNGLWWDEDDITAPKTPIDNHFDNRLPSFTVHVPEGTFPPKPDYDLAEFAKAAMQGMVSARNQFPQSWDAKSIAEAAVMIAKATIKELKKEQ